MLKIFNSLSNKLEEFVSHDDVVRMYSCGPTVYYYPHIGNMRAYIFMDSLRRILKYNGYKLDGVMNITDVGHLTSDSDTGEDKMEIASKRESKTVYEIAEYYTDIFMDNLKRLNIDIPEHVVKATEYVEKMIDFIKILEKKGYTYRLDDGIYFDVKKFKDYGRLSNKDMDDVGVARIEENLNKHHAFDFALWKFVEPNHIMKWDSPWGVGCPGWHIECSVMGTDILGEYIDIHTGGIDHKTVHHENEIAQNDCALGHQVVKYWMHCDFMQVNGQKMSKSLGNLYTLDDLKGKGYDALDYKYLCLNTNYRKPFNFSFEALESSKIARKNLKKLLLNHKESNDNLEDVKLNEYKEKFLEAINDDLNTPLALGILWTMLKECPSYNIYELALSFDKVFGLELDKIEIDKIPNEIKEIALERWNAKKNKDFKKSDELRDKLLDLGYIIDDKKDSYEIRKK